MRRAARLAAARRAAAGALLLSSGACGDGVRRADATADTATVASALATHDTLRPAPGDTTVAALPGDSAAAAPAAPTFVLRADSAGGDSLYHGPGSCQSCHGARGEGVMPLGPALNDSLWVDGDGSLPFIAQVTLAGVAEPKNARRGMPSYASRLTTAQAARIAAYVYALSHPTSVVETLPSTTTPMDTTTPP